MMHPIEEAIRTLQAVWGILAQDVEDARKYGQGNASMFAHRTLFRTFFAAVEGLTHQLRRVAQVANAHHPGLLDAAETELVRDFKYRLNDKGEPIQTPDFPRTGASVVFAMKCYAKVHDVEFQMDFQDQGWQAFTEFVKLRNGLMHPKSVEDLEPTTAQLRRAAEAAIWWKTTVMKLLNDCKAPIKE